MTFFFRRNGDAGMVGFYWNLKERNFFTGCITSPFHSLFLDWVILCWKVPWGWGQASLGLSSITNGNCSNPGMAYLGGIWPSEWEMSWKGLFWWHSTDSAMLFGPIFVAFLFEESFLINMKQRISYETWFGASLVSNKSILKRSWINL